MKKIRFFAVLAMLLTMVSMSSCSKYDDDEDMSNGVTSMPDNNTGEDESSDGTWLTIMSKSYGFNERSNEWPSTIKVQTNDLEEIIFQVNLPFSYTEWKDEHLTTEDPARSAFVRVEEADTEVGEWTSDGNGNYLRKITRTQVITFTKFIRTITSESWEAYRMINGKKEYYKTGSTSVTFNEEADHIQDVVSDSIAGNIRFEREKNFVGVLLNYHTESFELYGNTIVSREIGVVEDDEDPEDPAEEMPTADLTVDKIVKVSNITSSPIYVSIDKVEWHNVSFVETTDKYYVYVDGVQNCSWNKAELATSDKYNSVVYEPTRKQWIPAVLTVDAEGWDYVCEFNNHTYKQVSVSMNLACASGIKNFTENNTAEVSPWVKTITDSRIYDGKKWIKVSGFNVDGEITITYTVAEK